MFTAGTATARENTFYTTANALDGHEVVAQGVSRFSGGGSTGPDVIESTDGFINLDVGDERRYLYQLKCLTGEISVFRIGNSGSLKSIQTVWPTGYRHSKNHLDRNSQTRP